MSSSMSSSMSSGMNSSVSSSMSSGMNSSVSSGMSSGMVQKIQWALCAWCSVQNARFGCMSWQHPTGCGRHDCLFRARV